MPEAQTTQPRLTSAMGRPYHESSEAERAKRVAELVNDGLDRAMSRCRRRHDASRVAMFVGSLVVASSGFAGFVVLQGIGAAVLLSGLVGSMWWDPAKLSDRHSPLCRRLESLSSQDKGET